MLLDFDSCLSLVAIGIGSIITSNGIFSAGIFCHLVDFSEGVHGTNSVGVQPRLFRTWILVDPCHR